MDLKLMCLKDNFSKYVDVESVLIWGDLSKISPYITIAIPTYKRVDLLKEAIDSVINQDGDIPYEIIILDNDSINEGKSETLQLVKSYNNDKLYYFKHKENIGMIGNWNRCFELARGEFVTILHDDDWLKANYIVEAVKALEDKKVLFFKSNCVDMRNPMNKKERKLKNAIKGCIRYITPKSRNINLNEFFYGYITWGTNAILFNKEAAINIGGFDDEFFPFQDYHFAIKYCYNFGGKFCRKEIGKHRIMDNAALTLMKDSPIDVYNVRKEIINISKKNSKLMEFLSMVLFDENKEYVENFWHLEVDDIVEIADIRNKFSYKSASVLAKIFLRCRRIFYYS